MPGGICTNLLTADAASTTWCQITQTTTKYLQNNINTILALIFNYYHHTMVKNMFIVTFICLLLHIRLLAAIKPARKTISALKPAAGYHNN